MTSTNKKYLYLGLTALLILDLIVLAFYQYKENKTLTTRLFSVENQVASLSEVLKDSNTLSEENKQQLQELANRKEVIARSQDDLLTSAVGKASPAVVSIVISKDVPLLEVQYVNPFGNDPFFRDVGIRVPTYRQVGTEKKQVGAGTGFLIRSNGYIITNRHVVDDEKADYVTLLSTGEQKTAQVVYRDDQLDLAIIKISGSGYPTLQFGDSSGLKLGQTVAAIGNALGEYSNSVSVGIISGVNRTIQAQDGQGGVETLNNVLQTDAAINPGNSGGPLLDLTGKTIGVNVAMQRGASNIAFAIPIDAVKSKINNILK
ncbi:MAG: hypothetical protein COV95_01100 [Candidatus Zambryskibacteria bacterium CG11_big_fil_rev_8_21_14_0_20_40_24]|uniref:Serine protease n=1 Tax=Candidatus Zambryskibacteria bacterium CG11_big_fil_rev_8_21_14_0_20_40_24 TaxID=1975116 RepID=A0A2H0K6W7_9BACT|nr:MAG: hypothetical protein COV95_01100 [Candidatus Zambryskibacteria bacterium CG11_big_fil_rev_8_21_14_0_20_40_24]